MGLWSPEAPANKASVRREMGWVVSAGISSPTCRLWKLISGIKFSLTVPQHDKAAQFRDQRTAFVLYDRFQRDEFQRSVFLVIDVGNTRLKDNYIPCIDWLVIGKRLLAMQDAVEVHTQHL